MSIQNSEDGQNTSNHQSGECYVVQVIIRQAYKNVVKELTAFYLSQFEITKAIESILYAHILAPLPEEVRVEGSGFVLRGKRQPWVYGKTLELSWGQQNIKACDEKWSFEFEVADA
ncbi:hypothetical protein CPB83DRAFT_851218 [Crepidotus variabilis]|uniref:Uncharacterized protein n=1 Tax=Crepidotus variabilis TaxID=179855 RepID=A0A9P6EJZ8_9AGAR|nr:hypothetical protein CPB83DRAFT_851218 [Crepidotus variabilis]